MKRNMLWCLTLVMTVLLLAVGCGGSPTVKEFAVEASVKVEINTEYAVPAVTVTDSRGGTVAAHDDAVEPDPLPQLAEIAGAVFLVVEYGNHVVVALGVRNVVDARILDQIVIHAGLDDRVIVIRFDASCQRRGINADTAQGLDQVFARIIESLGVGHAVG